MTLRPEPSSSVWLSGISEVIRCPVAHGEGRLMVNDSADIEGRVAFRYVTAEGEAANGAYPANPNGSIADVAGLVDETGMVIGLMPHPEDHVLDRQDPLRRRAVGGRCLPLFRNGVSAVGG